MCTYAVRCKQAVTAVYLRRFNSLCIFSYCRFHLECRCLKLYIHMHAV